ncbi:MAG: hypothetical protein WCP45_07205 [Verrucomicrobiota bacterium]
MKPLFNLLAAVALGCGCCAALEAAPLQILVNHLGYDSRSTSKVRLMILQTAGNAPCISEFEAYHDTQ